jgi:hypothetical protein
VVLLVSYDFVYFAEKSIDINVVLKINLLIQNVQNDFFL